MATAKGPIVVQLLETAAPQAVRRLASLAKAGYYDGLTFNHTQPHVEIATDAREPGEAGEARQAVEIETEIDASALGLDRRRLETAGEAMDVAQRELAATYKQLLKSGQVHPRLQEWMDTLYRTHDAAFLVGVSRQELNEAQGYVYRDGLDSEPVTRGAVMLKPRSPTLASARLGIALTDIPQRTGRFMVVGRVVDGLETAQEISIQPLADPAIVRSRHQPSNPIRIDSIRFECRNTD